MMTSFKQDLLTEFEDYFSSQEFDAEMPRTTGPEQDGSLTVANAVDNYITAETEAPPLPSPFAELAAEFTITDQTGPAVDDQLANLVSELCKHQLPKAKLDAVLEKYRRPENCTILVAPKVNTSGLAAVKANSSHGGQCYATVSKIDFSISVCDPSSLRTDHSRSSPPSHTCACVSHVWQQRNHAIFVDATSYDHT